MKKKLLFVGLFVLIIGITVFIIGLSMVDFDFSRLNSGGPYVQQTFVTNKEIVKIVVKDSNAEVSIIKTESTQFKITYEENEKEKYLVSDTDGTLSVKTDNNLEWYDYIFNYSFQDRDVIIEVPATYSGSLDIKTNNGSIDVTDLTFTTIKLDTDNGPINIENVDCSSIYGKTNNGSIVLNNVDVLGDVDLDTNNGRLELINMTANDLSASLDNGKIILNNIVIAKDIYAKTSNGSITFTDVEYGENCSCKTSNGRISGTIVGSKTDFTFDCDTDNGNSNLPEDSGQGEKILTLKTNNGNISISFVGKAD